MFTGPQWEPFFFKELFLILFQINHMIPFYWGQSLVIYLISLFRIFAHFFCFLTSVLLLMQWVKLARSHSCKITTVYTQSIEKEKIPQESFSIPINGLLFYHLDHAHFFLNLALDSWNANWGVSIGVLCYSPWSHWSQRLHILFVQKFSLLARPDSDWQGLWTVIDDTEIMNENERLLFLDAVQMAGRVDWRQGQTLKLLSVWVWHACKLSGIWDLRIVEKTPRILSA